MKRLTAYTPCLAARIFVRIALFATLIVTLAVLFTYLEARAENVVKANDEYSPQLEYIVVSTLLSLGGGWLIDAVWKDARKKK